MKHFKPTFFLLILSIHLPVFSGFYNVSSPEQEIEVVPQSAVVVPAAAALAGTIIALVYPQDNELFTDFAKAAEYVQQTVFRTGQAAQQPQKPLALLNKPVFGMTVPPLMYGKPHNPWQYGPMCATAAITDDGSIACTLHNWSIAQQDRRGVCTFQWKELAKTVFDCNQPLLKNFIEAETKKQCAELQRHVNTWPWSLRSTIDAREYDVQQEDMNVFSTNITLDYVHCITCPKKPLLRYLWYMRLIMGHVGHLIKAVHCIPILHMIS